jgi:hypothetical protein
LTTKKGEESKMFTQNATQIKIRKKEHANLCQEGYPRHKPSTKPFQDQHRERVPSSLRDTIGITTSTKQKNKKVRTGTKNIKHTANPPHKHNRQRNQKNKRHQTTPPTTNTTNTAGPQIHTHIQDHNIGDNEAHRSLTMRQNKNRETNVFRKYGPMKNRHFTPIQIKRNPSALFRHRVYQVAANAIAIKQLKYLRLRRVHRPNNVRDLWTTLLEEAYRPAYRVEVIGLNYNCNDTMRSYLDQEQTNVVLSKPLNSIEKAQKPPLTWYGFLSPKREQFVRESTLRETRLIAPEKYDPDLTGTDARGCDYAMLSYLNKIKIQNKAVLSRPPQWIEEVQRPSPTWHRFLESGGSPYDSNTNTSYEIMESPPMHTLDEPSSTRSTVTKESPTSFGGA